MTLFTRTSPIIITSKSSLYHLSNFSISLPLRHLNLFLLLCSLFLFSFIALSRHGRNMSVTLLCFSGQQGYPSYDTNLLPTLNLLTSVTEVGNIVTLGQGDVNVGNKITWLPDLSDVIDNIRSQAYLWRHLLQTTFEISKLQTSVKQLYLSEIQFSILCYCCKKTTIITWLSIFPIIMSSNMLYVRKRTKYHNKQWFVIYNGS